MPFQSYGGGDNGIQPWIEDALAAAGAETPTILEKSSEPPSSRSPRSSPT